MSDFRDMCTTRLMLATSGSRVRFKNDTTGNYIDIHRPHPGSIMKEWMVKTIYQHLKNNGLTK